MEQIKLVIWDLDDTFWKGTLSEGPIEYSESNHRLIMHLSQKGIVNSICSKNDHDRAELILREQGIYEYFVFSQIDWAPKGPAVKRIIEWMQLRPENVLFVDDNHLNLEEARFFSPGIQTASPHDLENLLRQPAFQGKDDPALSRLKQYKVIEKKTNF